MSLSTRYWATFALGAAASSFTLLIATHLPESCLSGPGHRDLARENSRLGHGHPSDARHLVGNRNRNRDKLGLVEDVPRVMSTDRVELEEISAGYYRAAFRYGFMQSPNVAVALRFCRHVGLDVDPGKATFFLGHEEVIASRRGSALGIVRARLFAFLWRNSTRGTSFYNIASERVVAIGLQVIM